MKIDFDNHPIYKIPMLAYDIVFAIVWELTKLIVETVQFLYPAFKFEINSETKKVEKYDVFYQDTIQNFSGIAKFITYNRNLNNCRFNRDVFKGEFKEGLKDGFG
jgi:hypothetical protein